MIGLRDWKVDLRAVSQELSALSSEPAGEESHYVLGRISAPLRPDDAKLTLRQMTREGRLKETRRTKKTKSALGPLRNDDARLTKRRKTHEEVAAEGTSDRDKEEEEGGE